MFPRLVAVVLLTTALSAQRGGGSLTGAQETPLPTIGQPLTLVEQLHNALKLDGKTQGPAVDEILIAAAKEAMAVAQDMLVVRQALVNANLHNSPDEARALIANYAADEQKMAAIEAGAFAKIYALLKPNQQAKAPEAFGIMAGIFLPRQSTTARGGGRPGGRPGGGR